MKKSVTPIALVKIERKGSALLTPLEAEVAALKVTTQDEYAEADVLLGDIRRARTQWEAEIEPVLQPLREAKSAADALNRKVDRPLEQLERAVKEVMAEFKQKELRQLQKAQALADAARRQLEDLAAREAAARTRQAREKLAAEQVKLEAKIEKLEDTVPSPKVANSVVRTVQLWRVTDMSLVLAGILDGSIPAETIMLNNGAITRQFRENSAVMATWPGFELYDDIQIAGR